MNRLLPRLIGAEEAIVVWNNNLIAQAKCSLSGLQQKAEGQLTFLYDLFIQFLPN